MDKKLTDWHDRTAACGATENVLPGESPDAYQELWNKWSQEYEPETEAELDLLAGVVNTAWRLRRTHKAFTDVERALMVISPDASQWPRAQSLQLSRQQRYHASAETSFHRNLRLVEFMKARTDIRKAEAETKFVQSIKNWQGENPTLAAACNKQDAELAAAAVLKSGGKTVSKKENKEAAAPLSRSQQIFSGQANTKKRKKIVRLEQWVEVRIVEGQTVSQLFPSNEKLIERGKSMLPPPEYVYRRFNFIDGIPKEYDWVGIADEHHRERGGMGIQRMTIDTWLDLIETEAKGGNGHLTAIGNLPRPEEHGGCDCLVCTRNRAILEGVADPDLAA